MKTPQIIVPILISLIGVISMTVLAQLLDNGQISSWNISAFEIVNFTFTMQMVVLLISFVVIAIMFVYNKEGFKKFFRIGKKSSWNLYGPVAAIAFTLGTTLLMSAGVRAENGAINKTFYSLLPLVLLFAATNAWSEEIFTRFIVVAGLDGKLKPVTICWISALVFGLPHFFGTPGGLFGVITSGTMGWVLAKSVIESKGLGWALFIHFLQDVAIFGAGAMIIAGNN